MTSEKIKATIADEIALEQEYKQTAERILRATYEKAMQEGTAGNTKVGSRLIDNVLDTVRGNIVNEIFEKDYSKGGVMPKHWPCVQQLLQVFGDTHKDELYDMASLITMNAIVSACLTDKANANVRSAVVGAIAKDIELETKAWYYTQNATKGDAAFFEKGLAQRVQKLYKERYASAMYRKENYAQYLEGWKPLDKEMLTRMADILLELACKGSGYFEIVEDDEKVRGKASGNTIVRPKQWLIDTWKKNVDIMAHASYKYCPMVVSPRPWTSIWDGGYYDVLTRKTHLLRVEWEFSNTYMEQYKRRLNRMDLSYLFRVVNTLQSTPFKINERILHVATSILNGHGGTAGIDSTDPMPEMPRLENATKEEEKEYRYKLMLMYKAERARQSRLLRLSVTLGAAKKFSKYERIYFPWNMDYRGRLYPISTEISPQGDDMQKALLLFADPSPVMDEDAYRWFLIEGANRAGVDKVPFDDRVKWVQEHEEEIIKSSEDPLTNLFWAEQDEPFLFLAWCDEYVAIKAYMQEHGGSLIGYKCSIPLNYDGTCSGLQHFSMLLRDEIGGRAVNLVPQETVSDIYQIVADKINPILKRDAMNGTDDGLKYDKQGNVVYKNDNVTPMVQYGTKTIAQWWLTYARDKFGKDGITRKVCKRSVMTLAYGSGQYGFAENLKEDIIKPYEYAHLDKPLFLSKSQAANYLAKLIWDAVSTTVVKAVEGMKWLQKIAQLITKNHEVVQWVTPNGLLVQQNKYKEKYKKIAMKFNGAVHRIYLKEAPSDIDTKGQVQAISPNFIHSMDASHMQRVITSLANAGCHNVFMIHDSFGTDLAHAGFLFKIIRFEFRKMYEDTDYLQIFLDNVNYLLPKNAKVPKAPKMGHLSITDVEHSQYCFA